MEFKLYNSKSRYSKNYFSKGIVGMFHRNALKRVWKMINKERYGVVGDFGTGDGVFLECLLQLGKKVYAIDKNKNYLDLIKIGNSNLKIVNQDLGCLEFDKECFDLIVCLETLEHVSDYKAVLREMKRTLRKNGKAIVSLPIESGFAFFVKYFFRFLFGKVSGYSFLDVCNSFIGKLDKVKHEDHKGFDYSLVLKEICRNFKKVKVRYIPRIFSMRVIVEFSK